MKEPKFTTYGPLPVELVNSTIEVDLQMGEVIMTAQAKKHIAKDHPEDFDIVMQCMPVIIASPTYIGQSPHHSDAFEMVRRITIEGTQEVLLVAISLIQNDYGNYNIHSAYRINETIVDKRVKSGHLRNPKRKAPC